MTWWGKAVGGALGWMLGGPLGAILGAAIGHQFDRGLERTLLDTAWAPGDRERVQSAFFTALFSVMGHMAKADGRVSEHEIDMARAVMRQMNLTADQQRVAIDLFRDGKRPDFPLDQVLEQFRRECRGRRTLIQMFIEILLHAAYADGTLHPAERALLERIAHRLRYPRALLAQLEAMVAAQRRFHEEAARPAPERGPTLDDAYAALGVSPDAGDAEVKRAYRRLMSQHHPDRLVARGLPEEMIKMANEKTAEIKAAYERIRKARGMR